MICSSVVLLRASETKSREEISCLEFLVKMAHEKLANLKRSLNSTRAFHRRPIELTGEVLRVTANGADNIQEYYATLLPIRSVSSHIANIVNFSSAFWSQNTSELHPELVALALIKSGSRPLRIYIGSSHLRSTPEDYLEQIVPHVSRWQALEVGVSRCRRWEYTISSHGPPLEQLEIKAIACTRFNPRTISEISSLKEPSQLTRVLLPSNIGISLKDLTDFLISVPISNICRSTNANYSKRGQYIHRDRLLSPDFCCLQSRWAPPQRQRHFSKCSPPPMRKLASSSMTSG